MEFESTTNQFTLRASAGSSWMPQSSSASSSVSKRNSSASQLPERRPLMHRDVIGLIAFDLVLRFILTRMSRVAFERDAGSNDSADPAADSASFRVPAHVIS